MWLTGGGACLLAGWLAEACVSGYLGFCMSLEFNVLLSRSRQSPRELTLWGAYVVQFGASYRDNPFRKHLLPFPSPFVVLASSGSFSFVDECILPF